MYIYYRTYKYGRLVISLFWNGFFFFLSNRACCLRLRVKLATMQKKKKNRSCCYVQNNSKHVNWLLKGTVFGFGYDFFFPYPYFESKSRNLDMRNLKITPWVSKFPPSGTNVNFKKGSFPFLHYDTIRIIHKSIQTRPPKQSSTTIIVHTQKEKKKKKKKKKAVHMIYLPMQSLLSLICLPCHFRFTANSAKHIPLAFYTSVYCTVTYVHTQQSSRARL